MYKWHYTYESNPDGSFTLPKKNGFLGPYGPIYKTSVVKFLFSVFSDQWSLKIENENNTNSDCTVLSHIGE